MPRTARVEFENAIHHVTLRGNRGQRIFVDRRDYSFFVAELDSVARRYGWTWLSYCLMPNHCHLVVETPRTTLGAGMRHLAGRHAQVFNHRHETYGHLFQERYGSVLVRSNQQFAQLLRYVALNPVEAGLCREPGEWAWSSHRAIVERRRHVEPARERIESLLDVWGGERGGRYEALFDPAGPLAKRFGAASPWEQRPPLARLLAGRPLDEGMRVARDHGYRLAEIAAATGLHASTVSRRAARAGRREAGAA